MEQDEKKWFVYLGDHHEGPFSIADIQTMMADGHVSTANYIWCEGMGDWQLMSEVGAFAGAQQPAYRQASGGEFAESAGPVLSAAEPMLPASATPVEAVAYPDSASPISEVTTPSISRPEPSLGLTEAVASVNAAAPMAVAEAMPQAAYQPPAEVVAPAPAEMVVEHGGMSAAAIQAGANVQLEKAPQAQGVEAHEPSTGGASRFQGAVRAAGRMLPPIIAVAALAGIAFAYTAGYLDPILANPAVRAFQRTVSDASRPYLLKISEKFPALQGLISPIPHFDDLMDLDYQQLSQAAMPGATAKPRIAMALSKDATQGPAFYAASNLPDGSRLEVHVYGIEDTLLGQLSVSGFESITLLKRIGKSAPIQGPDGKPLPKGQYVIYLVESADDLPAGKAAVAALPATKLPDYVPATTLPKGTKILAVGSAFLGGPRDASYDSHLKEYHAKLAARAADELREVHQFTDTLQAQLDSTIRKYSELTTTPKGLPIQGKIPPVKLKAWDAFDKGWTQLSGTLDQSFAKWTPDLVQRDYFYGMLYQLTQQAGQAIELVHKTQQMYFLPTSDRNQVGGQLAQAGALAQSTLSNLRMKLEQAEKLPPTANGMPRRDGI